MTVRTQSLASLTARVVEPAGPIHTTAVFFHGYGAGGDDLVPLAGELAPRGVRYVFPAAPIALPGMWGDARAWWHIDLDRTFDDLARGVAPEGLDDARAAAAAAIAAVRAQAPDDKLVLGGFSQGAMLALDLALHGDGGPLAGLALMSGTLLAPGRWRPRYATLANVPVVISHGRQDPLLPFPLSEQLQRELAEAGARVTWVPFGGAHEIPPPVLAAVAKLLT